jgi:acyl-CoA synthetase (NDP forming)
MKAALDVLLTASEFDLIVAVPGSSARFEPGLVVRPLIECAGMAKPLAAFVVPEAPDTLAMLTAAGVPNFRTPEACADAIAAAFARRTPRALPSSTARRTARPGRLLDELNAYALLDRLGIAHAPAIAVDAKASVPPQGIPYPVAVKVLSADVAHKTDVGGVVLNVADERELAGAIAQIRKDVETQLPWLAVDRLLVQQMAKGLSEVLVGYRVDPQVGPIVMLASGGMLTEIDRDRSIRLAPVDLKTARAMIGEVKALRALAGYRGRESGDLDALADAVVKLSMLAAIPAPAIFEAEINPLLVMKGGEGVVAVDALVRLAHAEPQ